MFFGYDMEKFLLLLVVAAVLLGPERLPRYAEKLAQFTKRARAWAGEARTRVKDEMGEDFDAVEWQKLDPRQYDPRRIIRDALLDDAPVPLLGHVPLSPALRRGGDDGVPGVIADPDDAAARAITDIARSLAETPRGLAGRTLPFRPRCAGSCYVASESNGTVAGGSSGDAVRSTIGRRAPPRAEGAGCSTFVAATGRTGASSRSASRMMRRGSY